MISPSFQCDITSYSTWYHFAVQTRWYHFEKLGDITYLSWWYHFESYVISPSFFKWYHLLSQLCDITLIIKWYHLVQLVILLSSKVISHNKQGDITSKARWYHILLINSKTAPHTIYLIKVNIKINNMASCFVQFFCYLNETLVFFYFYSTYDQTSGIIWWKKKNP